MIINNSTVTCINKTNNQLLSKIFQHKNVLTYCMRNPGHGLRYTQTCLDILHEKSRSWFEIYTKMSWHIAWKIQDMVWDIHKNVLTFCVWNPGPGLRYTQTWVRIETGNGMLILSCLLLSQKRMAALRRQYYNRVNECS